jgi:hypothetical protein
MHPIRARALVLVFGAITIAGCAGVSPSGSPSIPNPAAPGPGLSFGPTPTPVPQSAWQRRLAAIQPDGTFAKADALALFATAYGPLPGVDVARDKGIADGTLAIRAVTAVRAQLTQEQRDAIDRAIAIPDGSTIVEVPPVSARAPGARLAAFTTVTADGVKKLADFYRGRVATNLGQDFRGTLEVALVDTDIGLDGDAWSDYPGGVFGNCRIRIYPPAEKELEITIAHEVFHCFQLDAYRTAEAEAAAPSWLIEGGAEWAAVDLTQDASPFWPAYIQQQLPLPQETYDAVGFFGHMDEVGLDPWTGFLAMWNAGNNAVAIMQAGGADRDQFVDSWASAVLRQQQLGGAWWTAADGHTNAVNYPQVYGVGNGTRVDLSMPYLQNKIRVLSVGSDLVHFTTEGHVRINDGHVDLTDVSDSWFCISGHSCDPTCPNGEQPPPISGTLSPTIAVASSGGIDGTIGTAEGKNLKDLEADCGGGGAPSDEPPDQGAFCQQYRDLLIWWKHNPTDVVPPPKEWAREIVNRSVSLYHVAPPEMQPWAAIVARTYAIYADVNVYADIPASGPGAAQLPQAGMTMDKYCGVTRDAQGWIKE